MGLREFIHCPEFYIFMLLILLPKLIQDLGIFIMNELYLKTRRPAGQTELEPGQLLISKDLVTVNEFLYVKNIFVSSPKTSKQVQIVQVDFGL